MKKAKDILPATLAKALAYESGSRLNLSMGDREDVATLLSVAAASPSSVVGKLVAALRGQIPLAEIPQHLRPTFDDASRRVAEIEREVRIEGLSDLAGIDTELAGSLTAASGIDPRQFAKELSQRDAAGREAAFSLVVDNLERQHGGLISGALAALKGPILARAELHALGVQAMPVVDASPQSRAVAGQLRAYIQQRDSHAARVAEARHIREILKTGKDLDATVSGTSESAGVSGVIA